MLKTIIISFPDVFKSHIPSNARDLSGKKDLKKRSFNSCPQETPSHYGEMRQKPFEISIEFFVQIARRYSSITINSLPYNSVERNSPKKCITARKTPKQLSAYPKPLSSHLNLL